ncbi:MAG TPA: hypothetical protein DEO84_01140, partial [candidate division Zixibacteria bacterium]|nr:hypothetical protein [candidate division Zixibacteria bacterium]
PDPSTDHSPTTDNKVLGVDLTSGTGGDYSASLGSTYYVTSPVYNCSGKYGVVLSFWRWLGVEQNSYDHAYFQVYSGSSWITLFENGGTTIDESAWSQFSYDVSAYANNNASFQIRFGIGTTDGSWQYCGWNIDDLMITALRCITVPNGTLAGTVTDSQGAVNLAYVHAVGGTSSLWDTTSTSGAYSISAPPGTYSVTFTQVDHRDTTIAGQVVTSNNTTTLNVVMQRLLSTVKGKVTKYPSSTTAVPNVRVVVNGAERSDTTDASGNYLMSGITEGTYSMFFTNPDYRDTTLSGVILTPGDSTTRNVQMVQFPGFVSGTVRDTAGTPLQNIFVRINTGALILGESRISHGGDAEDIPVITAVDSMYTNASGYYISRALDAATYNVRFTHTTYRDTTIHSVVVTPADTTVVSPVLKRRNHTPVITSPATAAATEHILFRYTATASDSDGVVPTIAFSLYPAWMTPVGDTIRGIPPNGSGNTSFRIIASDGQLADTQIVAVTVMAVNDPPTITSPAADTATEQQAFQYNATATDPESTPTISFFGYPNWLTTTGSAIFGTPPEGRRDTVFSVVASDSQLADTLVVTLHVITINDAPALSSQSIVTATRGENFDYLATANDPDNDILTFSFRHYDASWLISTPPHLHGVPGMANHDTTFEVIVSDGQLADTMGVYIYVVGGCYYTTGDVNESGTFTGLDVTYAVRYFKGGPDPLMTCDCPPHGVWFVTGDVNGSCSFTGLDVTYMVRYFKGGAEPIPCPDCAPNVILKKSGTSVNPMSQPIENKK